VIWLKLCQFIVEVWKLLEGDIGQASADGAADQRQQRDSIINETTTRRDRKPSARNVAISRACGRDGAVHRVQRAEHRAMAIKKRFKNPCGNQPRQGLIARRNTRDCRNHLYVELCGFVGQRIC